MARDLVMIGAPTSAASYAPGQEQAPRVLRERGLIDRLTAVGRVVHDAGDGPMQVWSPDRQAPRAQNAGAAALAIRTVAAHVGAALDSDADVLVIGGNCTIALGAMGALTARTPGAGLLYIDRHYDLNTPDTTTDGALDWMGMAHGLGLPGTVADLTSELGGRPLLSVEQVSYLGVDPTHATDGERNAVARLGLAWESSAELAREPVATTHRALRRLGGAALAVHVDVDVLDFTEAPLSESTGGRNAGPSLDALAEALAVACGDARFRVLSIGELNPARAAGSPAVIDRFIAALESALR